jgi:ubiquinone/menaquinone biosynthesis C-methylase UbiE
MDTSLKAFADFERAGWEDASIVAGYDENLSCVTTQSIPALLDGAGVRAGSRVLDVATGGGYAAEAAFQRGADAIGIDFSAAQISLARKRHPAVRFEQADAESLPFAPCTFDSVVCAFGICHLPDPDRALREAYRTLKPGGLVAFSVWDVPERAVGVGAVYDAIRAHGSTDVGLPTGPSFFSFSDREQSIRALRAAGFASPSVHVVPQVWRLDDSESIFDRIAESSVRAGITLRSQSPTAILAIRAALQVKVFKYKRASHFEIPMPAIVATAMKT